MKRTILVLAVIVFALTQCGHTEDEVETNDVSIETTSYEESNYDVSYEDTVDLNIIYGPYYEQLTDAGKQAYDEMYVNINNGISSFSMHTEITKDEFVNAQRALYREQPQLFWLENHCTYHSSNGMITSADFTFNELANNLEANKNIFNNQVDSILSTITGTTDYEKEKQIHDYLAQNVVYNSGSLDQSAYDAIVNHEAVCNGYTMAFIYLLQREGIESYYCLGTTAGSEAGSYHTWNIVKLGNGYYNVDVTWDRWKIDLGDYVYYRYYNLTDDEISTDHYRDESSYVLPACNYTNYSYESLYGAPASSGIASQFGITSDNILYTIDEFNQQTKKNMIQSGLGTHTYGYIVNSDACLNAITQSITNQYYMDGFVNSVINTFGMNGYNFTISGSYYELGNESYLYFLTVSLN